MPFPSINSKGKPVIKGNSVTFSYLTSFSQPVTETKPLLSAGQIVQKVSARLQRFHSSPPGTRESETSRAERKWIAAQPEAVLREAWDRMDGHQKMEFSMMFDPNSHFGLSDPIWAKEHAKNIPKIVGDDKIPLGGVESTKKMYRNPELARASPTAGIVGLHFGKKKEQK